jgi:hypothetical protein
VPIGLAARGVVVSGLTGETTTRLTRHALPTIRPGLSVVSATLLSRR